MSSELYLTSLEKLVLPVRTARQYPGPELHWKELADLWNETPINAPDEYLMLMAMKGLTLIGILENKITERVIADAMQLHANKNAGYAGQNPDPWANFRLATKWGISTRNGVLVRLSDKWARIQTLRDNADNDRVGESIIDTLADFAAYCIIATCVNKEGPKDA